MTVKQFKIEKGIPLPRAYTKGGGGRKYPWPDMKVGDSFLVPATDGKFTERGITTFGSRLRATARTWGRLNNNPAFKVSVYQVSGGARVWRIE